jgi:hypothetical protein
MLLPVVLLVYAALYMATSKPHRCDEECQNLTRLENQVTGNRPYVRGIYMNSQTDIHVLVDETVAINWNLFADTVCSIARGVSFRNKNVYVFNQIRNDTLGRKSCP